MYHTKSPLDIVIHCMGMPFDGDTIKKQSLGGSESAAYYQARELAARGHRVVLFTTITPDRAGTYDGVTYVSTGAANERAPLGESFQHYATSTPHDVLIIQRHPMAFSAQYASKLNILQLHDLALVRSSALVNSTMWNIDLVTCVSEWHKNQVVKIYDLDPEFVRVVPNGVDLSLYDNSMDVPESLSEAALAVLASDKFVMLYQSRPERGLEHLLRPDGIMSKLATECPQAHLVYCTYDNTVPQMAPYYAQLDAWAEQLPNVTKLGSLTKPQLAQLQKACSMLIYPTEFKEVSCITAMEAMAAGLPMLTSSVGALTETCAGSGTLLWELDVNGKVNEALFVNVVKDWAKDGATLLRLHNWQLAAAQQKTWAKAIDELEAALADSFERRTGSTAAAWRHAIEFSDVSNPAIISEDRISIAASDECAEMFAFIRSPEAYQAHYDKHQTIYYEAFREKVIGEDVTHSTRFRATAGLVEEALRTTGKPLHSLRVLDYGCAHGHYLIPLAKSFPEVDFCGMDISARAIGAAMEWCQRDNLRNVELRIGSQDLLAQGWFPVDAAPAKSVVEADDTGNAIETFLPKERELFDVIIAGEVLEHVVDYSELLELLRQNLAPGGTIIVTTPFGRWEWTGTEAFQDGREHLVQFERQDIYDICRGKLNRIYCAPAGGDVTGKALGSWVWSVTPTEVFARIDTQRKRRRLAPRETVSACLIVCNGERTIRKCIESFIHWVDEVVIAVDPKTNDRTRQVIEHLKADYRHKPITIVDGFDASVVGFDAARNLTLDQASGDWVLWLDADEEVQQPQNLWKYLRRSHHQAFAFPQVHYACDPPQVLNTDFPCRLFRRSSGAKFYGLVHEHPETAPGDAIPKAVVKHDVQFLHSGYVDEATRRARYQRNLPLLTRDMLAYPTRKLNRFLWLRDIAQGIVFYSEQNGGVTEAHFEQASEGIKLFEQMLDEEQGNMRMMLDSLPFYSQCVLTRGEGFDADVTIKMAKPGFEQLNCAANVKGRFHSDVCFQKLVSKLFKEGTKYYEHEYL